MPRPLRTVVAALGIACTGLASAQDPAAAVTPLTDGLVITREMQAGDVHRYSIELHAGEYLQVLVEQQGVDVAQTLTAPDGAVVIEADSSSGFLGHDPLAIIASTTGVYQLSLKGAVSSRSRRGYVLRVEVVKEPGPGELLRVKAVQAAADALRAYMKDPRTALEPYRAAAAAWEAAGDRHLKMWMDFQVAFAQLQGFGEYAEAAAGFGRTLATAVELGDVLAEARSRWFLAQSQKALGQLDEAKANLERSVALHREAGATDAGIAYVLIELGSFHSQVGEPQTALDYLAEALRAFRTAGSARGEATTLAMIGTVYMRLGDAELALEQYRLADAAWDRDLKLRGPRPGGAFLRARILGAMGSAHRRLDEGDTARAEFGEALALCKTAGVPTCEADVLLNLGGLEKDQGNLRAARQAYESALAVHQARSNVFGEGAALCLLGGIYRRLNEPRRARQAFDTALALAPRAGPLVRMWCGEELARLHCDAGDLATALAHAEASLEISQSARARVAGSGTRAASLAAGQSMYHLTMDILMKWHEADPAAGHDVAAFEVSERARARTLLELLGEGHDDLGSGVAAELLAEERSHWRRLNATASAESDAMARGRTEEAEALRREIDSLSARLAETEARIRRVSPRYAALTQAQPLGLSEIRDQVLEPGTQLLQYALGEESSFLWVVSATRLASFRLPPRAEIEAAARRVHALMSLPPAGRAAASGLDEAVRALSRLILAPAAAELTASRLLVVAPGALQYVPLGCLRLSDDTPVAVRFEVVSAPSASVIAGLRGEQRERSAPARVAAVFADPVFTASDPRLSGQRGRPGPPSARGAADGPESLGLALRGVSGLRAGELGRLPFSAREAEAIVSMVSGHQAMKATGFAATREAAISASTADYRIVHFATHGVLNARRPELSGVVLSLFDANGRRQDGFLRLHDIYNLRLDADLVVLSGCQTALGKDLRGEGLIGLTRGFMYAGAKAVVASLWQVDDESTAELMKRFYRGMLKEKRRPADALRAAQLEMSRNRRWSAPFYWAGFVIQGEWR